LDIAIHTFNVFQTTILNKSMKEEWCVENMRMILFDMREISAFFCIFYFD